MIRLGASLVGALAAGAAAVLPVPPIPPAGGPPGRAAPIPRLGFEAPRAAQQDGPRIAPTFFPLDSYSQSQGFMPGSQIEELPGRPPPVRAGVSLSIPLR